MCGFFRFSCILNLTSAAFSVCGLSHFSCILNFISVHSQCVAPFISAALSGSFFRSLHLLVCPWALPWDSLHSSQWDFTQGYSSLFPGCLVLSTSSFSGSLEGFFWVSESAQTQPINFKLLWKLRRIFLSLSFLQLNSLKIKPIPCALTFSLNCAWYVTKLVPVTYIALFTLGQSSIDFLELAWCAALPGSWNFYDDPPSSPFFGQVSLALIWAFVYVMPLLCTPLSAWLTASGQCCSFLLLQSQGNIEASFHCTLKCLATSASSFHLLQSQGNILLQSQATPTSASGQHCSFHPLQSQGNIAASIYFSLKATLKLPSTAHSSA